MMPREGETPEAGKWDELSTQKYSGGRGRRSVPQEATAEIVGGPPRDYDPFELAPHSMNKYGIDPNTHTYTWVQNPAVWSEHTGTDRVDEMEAMYDGAEPVRHPDTHDFVKRSDTILMKLPLHHLEARNEAAQNRADNYVAMNPWVEENRNTPYEEVLDRIAKRGDPALFNARTESFELGDLAKAKLLAARGRERSRNLSPSNTYQQSYEQAYNNQVDQMWMMNPGMTWRQAEVEQQKEIERMEDRAMMGATMDSGAANWADDIDRSAKRRMGMYAIDAGIGRTTREIVQERHNKKGRRG